MSSVKGFRQYDEQGNVIAIVKYDYHSLDNLPQYGFAELDKNGIILSSQLPSYVDDVLEGYLYNGVFYENSVHTKEIIAEGGKVYVDVDSNLTYRWSGSKYVPIASDLALGETSATAYRGDRGKVAYDHSQLKGNAYASNLYKFTTNEAGHVTNATVVTKEDITNLGIPSKDTTYSVGGDDLGLVKNGGNVTINPDGTMTAPESTGGGSGDANVVLNDQNSNTIVSDESIGYNFVSGTNNLLGIKGYKILSIIRSNQFESDPNLYHQLDIEVNDKDLDEKAVNSYAIKDIVNIVVSYHWVNCYAISSLSTNDTGNSVISVKPWSIADNNFYDRAVDNDVIVDYDTSDTENWLYVNGKSFGTPILRTRGATLTGEQNESVGRYTFGAGRQNVISDDGGVALGRQNKVGYLSFAQGRGNSVMNGYVFGDNNTIEWSNSLGSFVHGMDNIIRKPSKGVFIGGYNNKCVCGSYSSILGGNNEIKGLNNDNDCEFISIFGSMNKVEGNVRNTTLAGQYLHAAYSNQIIFGMRNTDDPNAAMVVAFPENGKENIPRNIMTIDKNGNGWHLGKLSQEGIPETDKDLTTKKYVDDRLSGKANTYNPVFTGNISMGRKPGSTVGTRSVAIGEYVTASGDDSHAEGWSTTASGDDSHAEGRGTKAIGYCSHAEGWSTTASGGASHSEGWSTTASGGASHSEGRGTTASGDDSHAEGWSTTASGGASHSEGDRSIASGGASHSEGCGTEAIGYCSHAEGGGTKASGAYSHAEGKINIEDTEKKFAHIIGNGTSSENPSNAHTVDWQGNAWYQGKIQTDGEDYAEFFEWLDGNTDNEDRVGLLVTLDGEKIKLANVGDEILGIISGTIAVLGGTYECEWNGKYLTDDFGRVIYDMVEEFIDVEHVELKKVEKEIIDEETNETRIEIELEEVKTVEKKSTGLWKHPRLNPDYDPEQTYVNRSDRPEWDTVGMLGKLYVRDDGTCIPNFYATVSENGIATSSLEKTNMRVLSRVTENVIRVLLK